MTFSNLLPFVFLVLTLYPITAILQAFCRGKRGCGGGDDWTPAESSARGSACYRAHVFTCCVSFNNCETIVGGVGKRIQEGIPITIVRVPIPYPPPPSLPPPPYREFVDFILCRASFRGASQNRNV